MKTQSAITQKGRLKTENGFQTAFLIEVLINGNEAKIVRRREALEEMLANERESNLYFTLRRHTFYPLNYGEDLKLRKTKRNA